jgi:hypothetical protein
MTGRRGNSILETIMLVPLLLLLLVGMVELARITYTYYTIHKALYTLARYVGTQQGINFCDTTDLGIQSAKAFALTGTTDSTGEPVVNDLTADMIQVRVERVSAENGEVGECECSVQGCDAGAGGRAPDFIVVSIPEGYPIRPRIPYLNSEQILFRPRVRVPFGGL